MKIKRSLYKRLEANIISVVSPEEISVTYDSLFGTDNAKETLQDIVNYFNSENPKFQPHTSYSIVGPLGSGKASLVFATAKASNVPVISLDTSIFVSCKTDEIEEKFELIFKTADILKKQYKGCIIMFRNIDETDDAEDGTSFYLSLIKHFDKTENIFIFALSGVPTWVVPAAVLEKNLFTTILLIEYPNLATREKIFEYYIKSANIPIASDVSINRLAKDSLGETPLSIAYIIKDAHLYSLRHNHEAITQEDFSETMMKISDGEKHIKMTEKERKLTAYHEAGHVVAGYFANPKEYVLKRVEISPRSRGSLGLTATDVDENKYSYFKSDFVNDIIECFGGMCAEELIFNDHTSGVVSDLSSATATAANMIKAYGMGTSIGPMIVYPGVTDSPHVLGLVDDEIKNLLEDLKLRTASIINAHLPELHALANALLDKETVLGFEIEEIFVKASTSEGSSTDIKLDPSDDIVK